MITFIKNFSLENIKFKLIVLYLLNITDIIFTVLLLGTGFYMEANSLMVDAVQSPSASFILKVLLPALLLVFLYIRMKKATETQLKKSNIVINIAISIYTLVNISHLVWFSLLPFFMFR